LDVKKSILEEVRVAVGLSADTVDYDTELLMHINSAIMELNQNGVGKYLVVEGVEQTWDDLRDPLQAAGNLSFAAVPQFITLSVKLLFDPPPPSSVEFHTTTIQKTLWRLKVAYEEPVVHKNPVVDIYDY
jgi:hypothetical protein